LKESLDDYRRQGKVVIPVVTNESMEFYVPNENVVSFSTERG
jgi:hypothetical protein